MKFHDHTIRFENFPKHLARHITKSQQMNKYGRKFSNKWKTAQSIPIKITHELDM
jgi:hypothetical protein